MILFRRQEKEDRSLERYGMEQRWERVETFEIYIFDCQEVPKMEHLTRNINE